MLNFKKSFIVIVSFLVAFTNVEAATLNFECEIKNEITRTGFFETHSKFKIETDNSSVLIIKMPPEGSIVLKENFNNYMNNIYASEYKNLTSKIALLKLQFVRLLMNLSHFQLLLQSHLYLSL